MQHITNNTEEIDVLTQIRPEKFDDSNLPSVEDLPVLPGIRTKVDLDLAANADGRVYVFFEGQLLEPIEYAIYSIDDSTLTFISKHGRLQDIGMKVHPPMRKYMRMATEIHLISFENKVPTAVVTVPMLVQNIGL